VPEAEEWDAEGCDIWGHAADHHDLLRVGGNELGSHFDVWSINSGTEGY
jgi:hypothetical protein